MTFSTVSGCLVYPIALFTAVACAVEHTVAPLFVMAGIIILLNVPYIVIQARKNVRCGYYWWAGFMGK